MKLLLTSLSALCCLSVPALAAAPSAAANSAREAARAYGTAIRNCDMVWALELMYPPLMYSMADQMAGVGEESEARRAERIMGLTGESPEAARQRRAAGYEKLKAKYRRMGEQLKASGFRVEEFVVGPATAEYVVASPMNVINTVRNDTNGNVQVESMTDGTSRTRIVILPTRLVYSVPDETGRVYRIQRDSFIYAVRDEERVQGDPGNGAELNKWYFIDGSTSINQIRAFFPKLPLNIKTPPCGDKVLN